MAERLIIGSDHGAVELKRQIVSYLTGRGYEVNDIGTQSEESVDYPDIAKTACTEFLSGGYLFGILLCGTGIGVSISANKIPGIRCALIHDLYTAELARAHNDANFIALGGRVSYVVPVEEIINAFISATHAGERHQRRVSKINSLDHRS